MSAKAGGMMRRRMIGTLPSLRFDSWLSRLIMASTATCILLATLLTFRSSLPDSQHVLKAQSHPGDPNSPRLPCYGPGAVLLDGNADNQLNATTLDGEYPQPFGGSHDALGLAQTWLSAANRYGPYGYNEDYGLQERSRVSWEKTDWGELQNQCALRNAKRFLRVSEFKTGSNFALRTWKQRLFGWGTTTPPRDPFHSTGRTAIVLRSWEKFNYTPEDMWNLRSIVTEAALATGGDYAVFLLVDIKDKSLNIHNDRVAYEGALRKNVPPELQSMALLFDESLLKSWYPSVPDHRPVMQIMQPLQLFARFYPDFDHYWQVEMDSRFTGHMGHLVDALSRFAKYQPRKQARERASYTYIPSIHGSYAEFSAAVNKTLNGGGMWGPLRIKEIDPIGPSPPTDRPEDDNFSWGVGEDADLIVLKPCADATLIKNWVWRDWKYPFSQGKQVPHTTCPPAQGRASWNLLNAIHTSQVVRGLHLPSEATLPSWALWHGLKMTQVPLPVYFDQERDLIEMEKFWNGGPIGSHDDGMAHGDLMYDWEGRFFDLKTSTTWEWGGGFPNKIMDDWLMDKRDTDLPYLMRTYDGHVMAPNMALHPRKTNRDP